MLKYFKPVIVFFASFFLLKTIHSQDSSSTIKGWKVESRKIDEGKYELTFSAPVTDNWQVYAPNQTLFDIKTTELLFTDSAAAQEGDFVLTEKPVKINSAIFDGKAIDVYEKNVS